MANGESPNQEIYRRLSAIEQWQAEHDGRINAWWEAQHGYNARMDASLAEYSRRLTGLERKVIFFSGAASAIGAIAGALAGAFLGG
ncbi:MAG: hypothetical protein GY720_22270 [bacterium]|nr:hypothetical protein [bacterium]